MNKRISTHQEAGRYRGVITLKKTIKTERRYRKFIGEQFKTFWARLYWLFSKWKCFKMKACIILFLRIVTSLSLPKKYNDRAKHIRYIHLIGEGQAYCMMNIQNSYVNQYWEEKCRVAWHETYILLTLKNTKWSLILNKK